MKKLIIAILLLNVQLAVAKNFAQEQKARIEVATKSAVVASTSAGMTHLLLYKTKVPLGLISRFVGTIALGTVITAGVSAGLTGYAVGEIIFEADKKYFKGNIVDATGKVLTPIFFVIRKGSDLISEQTLDENATTLETYNEKNPMNEKDYYIHDNIDYSERDFFENLSK